MAALHCRGRLGECRYKTGVGDVQLDQAGPVQLRTGVGDITVERADGDAELTTGSGSVRIDGIDGAAVVKNSTATPGSAGSPETAGERGQRRKSFGDKVVLDGIDLRVAEGTVFALLGPNGAGKTTTVHILSTPIGADAGELRVAGHDLARDPDAVRDSRTMLRRNLRHMWRCPTLMGATRP